MPDWDNSMLIRQELYKICKFIEKKHIPSDIEFSIKNKKIYLFQKREITDICKISKIEIPKYDEDKFIGSTNIVRGTGKITLPVVVMKDFGQIITTPQMILLEQLQEGHMNKLAKNYVEKIQSANKNYSQGYIYVTDEFGETISNHLQHLLDVDENMTTDSLTSNKKAVITTKHSSLSSHVMTIARERGMLYAGFEYKEDIFDKLNTGDVVSIYIQGREAKIYLENHKPEYLRNIYKNSQINIKTNQNENFENRPFYYEIKHIDNYKHLREDVLLFLNTQTNYKWTFEGNKYSMGGNYINENGKILEIDIYKYQEGHTWSIYRTLKDTEEERMPLEEFTAIANLYTKHLQGEE
jgi:hypothetical protein